MTPRLLPVGLGLCVAACVSSQNLRVDTVVDAQHRGLVPPTFRPRPVGPLVDAGRFAVSAAHFQPLLTRDSDVPASLSATGTGGAFSIGFPGADLQLSFEHRSGFDALPNGARQPLGHSVFTGESTLVGSLGGRLALLSLGDFTLVGVGEFAVVRTATERRQVTVETRSTWVGDDPPRVASTTRGDSTVRGKPFTFGGSGGLGLHWQPFRRLIVEGAFTAGAQPVLRPDGHAEQSCFHPAYSDKSTCEGTLEMPYFDHALSLAGQLAVTVPFGALGLSLRAYTTWVPAAPVLNEPLGAEVVARVDF